MATSKIIPTVDAKLHLNKTLSGDIISVCKSLPLGVSFFVNSNQPTNRPTNNSWGAYIFYKYSSSLCAIYSLNRSGASAVWESANPDTLTWNYD